MDQSNSDNAKQEEKRLVNGHTKSKDTAKTENFERKVLNMFKAYQLTKEACGDEELCVSYRKRPVVKWSYFASKENIDQLLEALNPRGFREKPLRDAIKQEYKQLSIAVEKCPLKAEIQAQKKDFKPKGRRRNQPTVDKSRYKTMEEFLEANLRDQILDLEDRIWQGGLGSVKNDDREVWRAKVENGIYSVFSKTETPASEECNANGINEIKENGDPEHMEEVDTSVGDENKPSMDNGEEGVVVKEEEFMECDDQQQPVVNGVKDDIKQECHPGNLFSLIIIFLSCSSLDILGCTVSIFCCLQIYILEFVSVQLRLKLIVVDFRVQIELYFRCLNKICQKRK